jgi:hypothetical protein
MARLQTAAVVGAILAVPVPAYVGFIALVLMIAGRPAPPVEPYGVIKTLFCTPSMLNGMMFSYSGMMVSYSVYVCGKFAAKKPSGVDREPVSTTLVFVGSTLLCVSFFVGLPIVLNDPSLAFPDSNRISIPTIGGILAALIFGLLLTVFLFWLGRRKETNRRLEFERLHPGYPRRAPAKGFWPRSTLPSMPRLQRPSSVGWGFLVGVGTFSGIAVSIYTSSPAVQLLLSMVAAVAAGVFAVQQLRSGGTNG